MAFKRLRLTSHVIRNAVRAYSHLYEYGTHILCKFNLNYCNIRTKKC